MAIYEELVQILLAMPCNLSNKSYGQFFYVDRLLNDLVCLDFKLFELGLDDRGIQVGFGSAAKRMRARHAREPVQVVRRDGFFLFFS